MVLFAGFGWFACVGCMHATNKHAYAIGMGILIGTAANLTSKSK